MGVILRLIAIFNCNKFIIDQIKKLCAWFWQLILQYMNAFQKYFLNLKLNVNYNYMLSKLCLIFFFNINLKNQWNLWTKKSLEKVWTKLKIKIVFKYNFLKSQVNQVVLSSNLEVVGGNIFKFYFLESLSIPCLSISNATNTFHLMKLIF